MKIRFNKFEKVAGLFVGFAIVACVVALIGIAIKNGWLASKIEYYTELESADGVHAGTVVQISGLRVGSVTDVELQSNDRVRLRFVVFERFRDKIRKDSTVTMFRPFVLAEKVLEVSVGSSEQEILEAGTTLLMQSSFDIMDMLGGKKMTTVLGSFDKLAESLKIVGEAFSDQKRTQALVQTLDRIAPLVQNMNTMALEIVKITHVANKNKNAEVIIQNLATLTAELGHILPAFNEEAPNLGAQLGQIVTNLNVLTGEFKKLTPAIAVIAPELPRTSKRAVEALDETVVLLKALQKSFLLRGNVKEVKEEEKRMPAEAKDAP